MSNTHDSHGDLVGRLAALETLVSSIAQMVPSSAALRDVFAAKTELAATAAMLARHGAGADAAAKEAQATAMRALHGKIWPTDVEAST
jgi:hypothetical protein